MNRPLPAPDPHLVGDPSRRTSPRLWRAAALMAVGIALPIASARLLADGLHPLAISHTSSWVTLWAVTALSLGGEMRAVALAWRLRDVSVGAQVVAGVAVVASAGLAVLTVSEAFPLVGILTRVR